MAASATPISDVIELTLGEGDDRLLTFRDPALTDPTDPDADLINLSEAIDGTPDRFGIIRFAAKLRPAKDLNAQGVLWKKSYDASEIQILTQASPTLGQAMLKVDEPDTGNEKPNDCIPYELFLTRQDVLRTGASAGTIDSLTNGSGVIVGTGTAFNLAKPGDVVTILGGANDLAVSRIQSITDANNMVLERQLWADPAQTAASFEIRRGAGRTAKVRDQNGERVKIGTLKLIQDVVGQL